MTHDGVCFVFGMASREGGLWGKKNKFSGENSSYGSWCAPRQEDNKK
ncbi:hypothetical protein LKD81_15575 [Lachnospiraceae bacterium CLA-AA-H215]|uniref:Uncharacterized protein n=1 Tax=Hominifimenecus microfluidus TaxID=2885348 RepID=A0AAE3EDK7_9FIRM|nr:hypothetical protein [Hominifimenecus microfluidus]MCC2232395.1 hypothetical protein [Hominifimenecus microfluidus]